MSICRIGVVGGGIVGLTTAYELSRLPDFEVTLFDPAVGAGATYAAAGMLAPTAEIRPGEEASFALQQRSIPAWESMLATFSQTPRLIHRSGTLYVGWDASDRRQLTQFEGVLKIQGAEWRHVLRENEEALLTGLHSSITSGVFLPGDAWLNPDLAVEKILEELNSLGTEIVPESAIEVTPNGLVRTNTNSLQFDAVVLATGAAQLDGSFPSSEHKVRPVRGVTVQLRSDEKFEGPMIRAFIRGRDFYCVNRGSGEFVIGASSEERSDLGIEVGELERLLRDTSELLPFLESATIISTRRGLRPASLSSDPFLERVGNSKVIYSSGHFRHGVTLAPVTAEETVTLVKEILSEG